MTQRKAVVLSAALVVLVVSTEPQLAGRIKIPRPMEAPRPGTMHPSVPITQPPRDSERIA